MVRMIDEDQPHVKFFRTSQSTPHGPGFPWDEGNKVLRVFSISRLLHRSNFFEEISFWMRKKSGSVAYFFHFFILNTTIIAFKLMEVFGWKIEIIFGPQALVGRGIRAKAEQMAIDMGDDEMETVRRDLKAGIAVKGGLTEAEMEDLIRRVLDDVKQSVNI